MKKITGLILCTVMAGVLCSAVFADEIPEIPEPESIGVIESDGDVAVYQEEAGEYESAVYTEQYPEFSAQEITGGWTVYEGQEPSLTQEEQERFDKAAQQMVGVDYIPVAVLAQQLVSGMNYAYLCKGTPVAPGAHTEWYIVVVYEDLQGEVNITNICKIAVTHIRSVEEQDGADMMGAWEISCTENAAGIPEEVLSALADEYHPVAVLAEQVVSGMNYRMLCFREEDSKQTLYSVTVYVDIQGSAQITEAETADLVSYAANPSGEVEFTMIITDSINGTEDEIICTGIGSLGDFMRTWDQCEWTEDEYGITVTAINGIADSDSASWSIGGMPFQVTADSISLEEGGEYYWIYG